MKTHVRLKSIAIRPVSAWGGDTAHPWRRAGASDRLSRLYWRLRAGTGTSPRTILSWGVTSLRLFKNRMIRPGHGRSAWLDLPRTYHWQLWYLVFPSSQDSTSLSDIRNSLEFTRFQGVTSRPWGADRPAGPDVRRPLFLNRGTAMRRIRIVMLSSAAGDPLRLKCRLAGPWRHALAPAWNRWVKFREPYADFHAAGHYTFGSPASPLAGCFARQGRLNTPRRLCLFAIRPWTWADWILYPESRKNRKAH